MKPLSPSLWATLALYLVTVIHHAYGAAVYDTPWRLHVVGIGAVALLPVVLLAAWAAKSRRRGPLVAYALASFVLFGLPIGFFEGGYNHVVKNVAFLAGAGRETLDTLYFFAVGAYEIPNDWIFEVSGGLQLAVGLVQARLLWRLGAVPDVDGAEGERRRLTRGEMIAPFAAMTIRGESVPVPDPAGRWVHLHFRRFAGCPICITHLRAMARQHEEIVRAGVRQVVFFHSSAAEVEKHEGGLPFDLVADVSKTFYRRFAVEQSWSAFLHPRALGAALRSAVRGRGGFKVENGRRGLPADFLLDASGRVIAVHYGTHAFDQWDAGTLLALVAGATPPQRVTRPA